ncbi:MULTISPECIES: hypothetical protein [Catenuloplanes]|uniref:Uncharacterized protein n=1 Tax=Catenuloplanes niger TaxID=587534 RepID=A0AAE4CT35_9ACTN|nr:hypothetical protein [Catenuloplanes niger]MDR7323665.1 hypothetical protein [Catenuloplanes niger]
MSSKHDLFHFSVTVWSENVSVLSALRGLSFHYEEHANPQIASGGTGAGEWFRDEKLSTFHFTSPKCREDFLTAAGNILKPGLWHVKALNDNDPARPRKRQR